VKSGKYFRVRYEDVCADPTGALSPVFSSLGTYHNDWGHPLFPSWTRAHRLHHVVHVITLSISLTLALSLARASARALSLSASVSVSVSLPCPCSCPCPCLHC